MLGHHRPASETSFKWRFAGGTMMACIKCYLDPLSPHQKQTNKTVVKVGPSGKTFWIRPCHGHHRGQVPSHDKQVQVHIGPIIKMGLGSVRASSCSIKSLNLVASSLQGLANTTCADQPAHRRSLISAFVIRFLESIIY